MDDLRVDRSLYVGAVALACRLFNRLDPEMRRERGDLDSSMERLARDFNAIASVSLMERAANGWALFCVPKDSRIEAREQE